MTATAEHPTLDDMTPAILAVGGRLIPLQGGAPDCGLVPVLDCGPEMLVEVHCWPHPRAHGRLYVSAQAGLSRVVVPCPPASLVPKGETLAEAWLRRACETATILAAEHHQRLIAADLDLSADPARLDWAIYGHVPLPILDGYTIRARAILPGTSPRGRRDQLAVDIDACHPSTGQPAFTTPVWTSESRTPPPRHERLVDAITRTTQAITQPAQATLI